jgi:outer membrane protein OmpA-like peptidoglycan-associated protein
MNTHHHIARMFAVVVAIVVVGSFDARAQNTLTSNDLIDGLKGLEETPNIDVAAMRARAAARAKANADKNPVNREPIAEQLFKLPQLTLEIQFNLDSNIIRPESYVALGRIADALYHPYLLGYRVLVVGHTDATGRREYNLGLSQRRADAIREALVTSFKISPQRVLAVGLGEEQLQDPANPAAAVNRRVQLVTIGQVR